MKRFAALLLSLIMTLSLCACGVKPGGNGIETDFTQPEPVTLADGSMVYSKEPFVEFPQTGEYKETALLTDVPGQKLPLLLDIRQDGTIDYIFAGLLGELPHRGSKHMSPALAGRCFTTEPPGKP